jgi:hypothetical protein
MSTAVLSRHLRMFRELVEGTPAPTVSSIDRLLAVLRSEGAERDVLEAVVEFRGRMAEAEALRQRAALGVVS